MQTDAIFVPKVLYAVDLITLGVMQSQVGWLSSNQYINQHKNLSFGMSFSLIRSSYEFLTGNGDDMCRQIVKEEYFTVVRSEM